MNDMRGNRDNLQEAVLMVEMVHKINLYGYHGENESLFLKITVALPRLIAPAKRLLEKEGIYQQHPSFCFQVFEANIDFDIR